MIETFGGNIVDYPAARRKFKKNSKKPRRTVKISIVRYYGVGQHYWITLHEEDNPVWDGKGWRMCWDDIKGKGRIFSEQCTAVPSAKIAIERLKREHFSPLSHYKFVTNNIGLSEYDEEKWLGIYKQGE